MSRLPKVPNVACAALALGLLFATASGLALEAHAQQTRVGVNAAVTGKVYVTGAEAANRRQAKVRENVYRGDAVQTEREAALQILLLDETIFTVGQNCQITVDEFVYDPNGGSGKVAATIAKGAFRFMTGKIGTANPSNVSLRTPASTIGIRGTMGEVAVGPDAAAICRAAGIGSNVSFDPATASLVTLRGPGRSRNSFDKSGRIIVSGGGRSVEVSERGYAVCVPHKGAVPLGPFRLDAAALAYFDTWLRSTPRGAGINPADVTETGGALSDQNLFNQPSTGNDPHAKDRDDATQDYNLDQIQPYGGNPGTPPPGPHVPPTLPPIISGPPIQPTPPPGSEYPGGEGPGYPGSDHPGNGDHGYPGSDHPGNGDPGYPGIQGPG